MPGIFLWSCLRSRAHGFAYFVDTGHGGRAISEARSRSAMSNLGSARAKCPNITNWSRKLLREEELSLYGGSRPRFRFVINARERNAGGRTQRHPMCRWDRVSVRRAPLDDTLLGSSRAKRRWGTIGSLACQSERIPGVKRS